MVRLIIFIVFIFYNIQLFAQNETAEKYYHFILNEEIAVGNELVKLSKSLSYNNTENIQKQYLIFKNQINTSIDNVAKLESFSKSKYLKDASLKYFEVMKHLAKTDFKLLIDIYAKDNISTDDKKTSNQNLNKIQLAVDESYEKLENARKKFVDSNHLTIDNNQFKFYLQ